MDDSNKIEEEPLALLIPMASLVEYLSQTMYTQWFLRIFSDWNIEMFGRTRNFTTQFAFRRSGDPQKTVYVPQKMQLISTTTNPDKVRYEIRRDEKNERNGLAYDRRDILMYAPFCQMVRFEIDKKDLEPKGEKK